MRTGKESSGRSSGRKSATPYKSAVPYKNMEESRTALAKSARPVHTVKLPKSQMPSRQTEEHKALQRVKYQKKKTTVKTCLWNFGWFICTVAGLWWCILWMECSKGKLLWRSGESV